MVTNVLAADGSKLMPTYNIRKVRHMLKDGRARIAGHRPHFTIQLTYGLPEQEAPHVQESEFELKVSDHITGVSVKSVQHEFERAEYELLVDETEKHADRKKYRRTRRGRKRYCEARFDNRSRDKGWLAPSVENKLQRIVDIVDMYLEVYPVSSITILTDSYDTQLLEAMEKGTKLPEGDDYQHGPKYNLENTREAVFVRDEYTCQVCGKSIKDGKILRVHHIGFWKGDHSNRLSNLMCVCKDCHTSANHKPGGALWGLRPRTRSMENAAFMNQIRHRIADIIKERHPDIEVVLTNSTAIKCTRKAKRIKQSASADAYCMGTLFPKHKARPVRYKKHRRNNRVLSKFFDAQYIDIRDGRKRSGKELGCGRTDRSVPRDNPNNLRRYHGRKIKKGEVRTRKQRYPYQSGDIVIVNGRKELISGTSSHGKTIVLKRKKADGRPITYASSKVKPYYRSGSWIHINDKKDRK